MGRKEFHYLLYGNNRLILLANEATRKEVNHPETPDNLHTLQNSGTPQLKGGTTARFLFDVVTRKVGKPLMSSAVGVQRIVATGCASAVLDLWQLTVSATTLPREARHFVEECTDAMATYLRLFGEKSSVPQHIGIAASSTGRKENIIHAIVVVLNGAGYDCSYAFVAQNLRDWLLSHMDCVVELRHNSNLTEVVALSTFAMPLTVSSLFRNLFLKRLNTDLELEINFNGKFSNVSPSNRSKLDCLEMGVRLGTMKHFLNVDALVSSSFDHKTLCGFAPLLCLAASAIYSRPIVVSRACHTSEKPGESYFLRNTKIRETTKILHIFQRSVPNEPNLYTFNAVIDMSASVN